MRADSETLTENVTSKANWPLALSAGLLGIGQNGLLVVAAHEQGGSKAARDIDELVSEVTGMFAGGRLSDEALDGAMKALNDAYWIAKEKNKKYTPKKYRKGTSKQ